MCGMTQKIGQEWIHRGEGFGVESCPFRELSVVGLLWICRTRIMKLMNVQPLGEVVDRVEWVKWMCQRGELGVSNATLSLAVLLDSLSQSL